MFVVFYFVSLLFLCNRLSSVALEIRVIDRESRNQIHSKLLKGPDSYLVDDTRDPATILSEESVERENLLDVPFLRELDVPILAQGRSARIDDPVE